jgi:signal transduction histidine kinase
MLNYTHPGRSIIEQANIHELLENTLVFIRSKKKDKFEIETDFCRDLPRILCYPGELIQVFMNLLINAADAVEEKDKPGLIKIITSYNENEVIIAIADNGCGIADEIKDNIYNPFFTTKEVGKGTGQGLALVHNIVTQRHKGRIYFESQVGEGTTFYVHLPISLEVPDDDHEYQGT